MVKISTGLSFGVTGVISGQKTSGSNEPQLVVNSTSGKFVITAAVSKAMMINAGEKIMFLNNIPAIDAAIAGGEAHEALAAWCEENGIDMNTTEGYDEIIKANAAWFIAKGVLKYNNHKPVMTTGRVETKDKIDFLAEHKLEIATANHDELAKRFDAPNATDEELADMLTIEDIQMPEYHDSFGSKTATTSSNTGIGLALNFTDNAVWMQLKADLGKDVKGTVNRVFDVDVKNPEKVPFNDGDSTIEVLAYPITFAEDKAVTERKHSTTTDTQAPAKD